MAGHWGKEDLSTKVGNCAGRDWNDTEGATCWQITLKGGWGGGGLWRAIGAKTTCPRKVGNFAERGWDDTECAKSLGMEGGGWQGIGAKTTCPRKVGIVQGGDGMTQRVPHGGKSLGKEGGGWRGIGIKTTCSQKVRNCAGRGWDREGHHVLLHSARNVLFGFHKSQKIRKKNILVLSYP